MNRIDLITILYFHKIQTHPNHLILLFAQYSPLLFLLLLTILWFLKKETRETLLNSLWNVLLAMLFNNIISQIYYRPRPFTTGLIRNLTHHGMDSSFPSDHTTFAMAISMMLLTNKETELIGVIAYLLAILAGIARVFVGVHYPTDLLGSFLVSTTTTIIIFKYREKLRNINQSIINIYEKLFTILKRGLKTS